MTGTNNLMPPQEVLLGGGVASEESTALLSYELPTPTTILSFQSALLTEKRTQSHRLQQELLQKQRLNALKQTFERLQLKLEALCDEQAIHRTTCANLKAYPRPLYLDILAVLLQREKEGATGIQEGHSDSAEQDGKAAAAAALEGVERANSISRTSQVKTLYEKYEGLMKEELGKRRAMQEQVKMAELKRTKLKEILEGKELVEWQTFKTNFKGLIQSCQIFMPFLGTSLDALRMSE
jgi:uncharacterized protein YsxB (DUF464 family)